MTCPHASLRLGLISDTHGTLPAAACAALKGCDHIIHAGDIGSAAVIFELEALAPVTAVLGNCDLEDYGLGLSCQAELALADVSILVAHRPLDLHRALAAPGVRLPRLAVHGHTHTPREERVGAVLTVCPGSPCYPRRSAPSVMVLVLREGSVDSVELIEI
ncbi:MAG: YfcE family phosphodiesterase [Coriobacteriales bacterium]|jgi:putative phosphoesterase|nr:YfcE family phosphodiesterase [Coriobacteriales bacterium]